MCWKLSSASAVMWPSSIKDGWLRRDRLRNSAPECRHKLLPAMASRIQARNSPWKKYSCGSSEVHMTSRNFHGWDNISSSLWRAHVLSETTLGFMHQLFCGPREV